MNFSAKEPNRYHRWLLFLPLFLAIGLGVLLFLNLGKNASQHGTLLIEQPLPTFQSIDLWQTETEITPEDFKGYIVLLNVWSSWCSNCKDEHAYLMSLRNKPTVRLYGLNYRDSRESAIEFLKQSGNPYWRDIYDPHGELAAKLGVVGTPETYLINPQGMIIYRYNGKLNRDVWNNELKPLIDGIIGIGK